MIDYIFGSGYDIDLMRLIAITVFLSSFLVFQVQPLIGKYILPWFGGTPAVWTACMLFFQSTLLGGYAYAHIIVGKCGIKRQVIIHTTLLIITLFWLPITPPDWLKPVDASWPVMRVLLLLMVSVGGPFLLISAMAPLLQSWFSQAFPEHSPYRLYALSNLGSLLGLFAYPFIVERMLRLPDQTWVWSIGYFVFVILCSATGWWVQGRIGAAGARENRTTRQVDQPDGESPSVLENRGTKSLDAVLWLMLSACGSVVLLAVTNQLCQNVAAVPFLWVLPLGLYLVTFILCFDSAGWYRRGLFGILWIVVLFIAFWLGFGASLSLVGTSALYCFILFVCCMVCHGELSGLKPEPQKLTLFFFLVSVGGALGGIFVLLVAPVIFNLFHEFYVGVIGTGVALLLVLRRDLWKTMRGKELRSSVLGTTAVCGSIILLVIGISWLKNRAGLGGGYDTIAIDRNFYGIVSVQKEESLQRDDDLLAFTHGNTTHGFQFVSPERRSEPTGYYQEGSGVGLALRFHPKRLKREPLKVGLIGLGVGTLACYSNPEDVFQFYEIDPNVEKFARKYFTCLSDGAERGAVIDVFLGDARILLEKQLFEGGSRQFDVLVLDAFSSDAVPAHLLTEECFALYKKHLRPDGILAVHISNRHLNLAPVVRSSSTSIDTQTIQVWHQTPALLILPERLRLTSHWVLATNNNEFLKHPKIITALTPWDEDSKLIRWTDNFSSLFQVMNSY